MSVEYTPGPWKAQFGGMDGDQYFTVTCTHADYVGLVCEYTAPAPRPSGEVRANARLIASAPDLLEACRACLRALTDSRIGKWEYMEGSEIYSDFDAAAAVARAAIAKAEGK